MFHNIALSGGGTHTLAFLGCVKYLEEIGELKNIKNLIGASAGSIFCLVLVLNWSYKDIYDMCIKELIPLVDKMSFSVWSLSKISSQYGMSDGKEVEHLVEKILEISKVDKDITFLDLAKTYGKNIVIATTNLTSRKLEYLSVDTYPEMKLVTAIRMSTSIPILFTPVKYYDDLYVDSLVYNNFPVDFFSKCKIDTLGLNIVSSKESKKINSWMDYICLLYAGFKNSVVQKSVKDFDYICNICVNKVGNKFDILKMKFVLHKTFINQLVDIGYKTLKDFYTSKGVTQGT